MHRLLAALLLCLALVPASAAAAKPVSSSRAAEREVLKRALLEVMNQSALNRSRTSIQIQSLDDGAVIFSHNADELLNPASNVKLFTSAAALARLGPEFRFETEFYTDVELDKNGRAKVLYVKGKGDPSLTTERLYGVVSDLMHAGLKDVPEIVLDESWFDDERLAPGYDQEDSDRAYMAPSGALSLNVNAVGIFLRAGNAPGAKGVVEVDPPSDYFSVESTLTTGSRRVRRFSIASRPHGDKQKIIVRGLLPFERGAIAQYKKIDNPPMYFGYTLKAMLAARGVKVRRVRLGPTPPNAKLLIVASSETFDVVLKRLNKYSSNFVAEQLLKTLSAEVKGPPGTFAGGIDVVEDFVEQQVGIPRGSYVMKNGSGLNDTNRFSAAQTVKLMRYMVDRFPLTPEFLSSVPIAGKDGTLKYRFAGSEAVGRLRAKTGTLENVTALSGYVMAAGGERFVFAFIANDFPGRAQPVIQGLDALGAAVAAAGGERGPRNAVAQVMSQDSVVGSHDELKARIKTYLALGKAADKRNVAFLRTAWRSEKDPAVRAVVANAIYESNPDDYLGVRTLLDSFTASEAVYSRLRTAAKELNVEVPAVVSMIDLAASGNGEAIGRLIDIARVAPDDAASRKELADAFTDVARTAPDELLMVLKGATAADRDVALSLIASGLSTAADAEHPFWPALKKAMGSVDASMVAFARQLEGALALRIAEEKAPKVDAVPATVETARPHVELPEAQPSAEARPGGG